jgi:hypothetical protein
VPERVVRVPDAVQESSFVPAGVMGGVGGESTRARHSSAAGFLGILPVSNAHRKNPVYVLR